MEGTLWHVVSFIFQFLSKSILQTEAFLDVLDVLGMSLVLIRVFNIFWVFVGKMVAMMSWCRHMAGMCRLRGTNAGMVRRQHRGSCKASKVYDILNCNLIGQMMVNFMGARSIFFANPFHPWSTELSFDEIHGVGGQSVHFLQVPRIHREADHPPIPSPVYYLNPGWQTSGW